VHSQRGRLDRVVSVTVYVSNQIKFNIFDDLKQLKIKIVHIFQISDLLGWRYIINKATYLLINKTIRCRLTSGNRPTLQSNTAFIVQ